MSKCFITKYPVEIDNDNLPRINTMRIKFQRVDNPTSRNRSFRFNYPYGTNVTFHYIGNGHFTDSTLTQDLGKKVTKTWGYAPDNIYMSNDEGEVEFDISKIASLQVGIQDNVNPDYTSATNLTCDLNHLKGRTQVNKINMPLANNNVKLDLSSIKDLVNMRYLVVFPSTQVTGDIANLANMTSIIDLGLNNTQVTGDITNLANMTSTIYLNLRSTQVSGNITNLANMKSMTNLSLSNTQVSGNIANLANLTSMTNLGLSGTQVSGDITNIVTNLTKLRYLSLPKAVTITDAQKKTLTDRGCTVRIDN